MAGARSLVYVPKGTLHAHRAIGVGMGRMLVSQTPGGEAGPLAFVGRQGRESSRKSRPSMAPK